MGRGRRWHFINTFLSYLNTMLQMLQPANDAFRHAVKSGEDVLGKNDNGEKKAPVYYKRSGCRGMGVT